LRICLKLLILLRDFERSGVAFSLVLSFGEAKERYSPQAKPVQQGCCQKNRQNSNTALP
jgi:hypothetical protein